MSPSLLIDAKELESYRPLIDPRRLAKPAVIKGRNFLFDVDGPRSYFATKFVNWQQFSQRSRLNVREFRVNDRFFYGTADGIWIFNPVTLLFELSLPVVTIKKFWPWSYAQVGNLFYFAQHDAGLWQYDDNTGIWKQIPTPATVRGVCLSYGRLFCLSDTTVFWSALDDGTDFTLSFVTGAGFQALSLLSQKAFRVDPVSDGVIISTDKGLIKGEKVQANYVFRWYVVSRSIFCYSPNMATVIPDIGLLILDAHGFHIHTDSAATTWQTGLAANLWEEEMGDFLMNTYLIPMNKKLIGCVYLYYSHAQQLLFVGIAPNLKEGTYTTTFVYSFPAKKWGVFSEPNHGTFEVTRFPNKIDTPGYMDLDGYMHHFGDGGLKDREALCAGGAFGDIVIRKEEEPDVRIVVGLDGKKTYYAITDIHLETDDDFLFDNLIEVSGLYTLAERQVEEVCGGHDDPDWTEVDPDKYRIQALDAGPWYPIELGGLKQDVFTCVDSSNFYMFGWFEKQHFNGGQLFTSDPHGAYETYADIQNSGMEIALTLTSNDSHWIYMSASSGINWNTAGWHWLLVAVDTNVGKGKIYHGLAGDPVGVEVSGGSFSHGTLPFATDFDGHSLFLLDDDFEDALVWKFAEFTLTIGTDIFTGADVSTATRALFVGADGRGADPALYPGTKTVFLTGPASTYANNALGTAGAFTPYGPAVIDASDSPSD